MNNIPKIHGTPEVISGFKNLEVSTFILSKNILIQNENVITPNIFLFNLFNGKFDGTLFR